MDDLIFGCRLDYHTVLNLEVEELLDLHLRAVHWHEERNKHIGGENG